MDRFGSVAGFSAALLAPEHGGPDPAAALAVAQALLIDQSVKTG